MMYIPQFFLAAADAAGEVTSAVMDMADVMDNGMTTAEKLSMSGQMLADGLGTVFLVLILLWGVLSLFRLFFYDIPNKNKRNKQIAAPVAEEIPVPVQAEASAPSQTQEDVELVAVLTAAVAAYMETENQVSDTPEIHTVFRVVSFKRVRNGNGWNKSGR